MTEDDDLRSRLRHADPAAALAPLTPDETSRLLEEAMTTTSSPVSPVSAVSPPASTRRRRRPVILAAAGLVLLAVAGASWLLTRPEPTTTSTRQAIGVSLTVADGPPRKCMAPTSEILATRADFAFAGTVTAIEGDEVTLSVTHIYKGTNADEVQVAQRPDTSEQLMGSGRFETGQKYLIASSAGDVLTCGYSGEADSSDLQDLYDKAF